MTTASGAPVRGRHRRRGLNRRRIAPVFTVVTLDATSNGIVLSVLIFLLEDMGASPVGYGVVLAVEALGLFLAAPLLGRLSDRFGRRTVLLASQLGALLSLSLLVVADTVVMVLIARSVLGLTAAGTFPSAAAYVADHSSAANRRQGIGMLSAGLGLGGVVGPSLAGVLPLSSLGVSSLGSSALTAPIWVALALAAVNVAVTGVLVKGGPGSRRPGAAGPRGVVEQGVVDQGVVDQGTVDQDTVPIRVSSRSVIGTPAIRVLVVVLLCHYFSYGIFNSQLPAFLTETFSWDGHPMGQAELGYVLSADGAINIAVQLFLLQPLGRRIGERNLIVMIFVMMSAGYVLALSATTIPTLALALLCVSTGQALARPTFVAALSVRVPSRHQGVLMGATQSLVAVADIVTPLLAGLVVGQGLYGAWIACVVAVAVLGAVVARTRLTGQAGAGG